MAATLDGAYARGGPTAAVRALVRRSLQRFGELTQRGEFVPAGWGVPCQLRGWGKGEGPPEGFVYLLAIDPKSSNTLYASTQAGLFKSTDGAVSWSAAGSGLPDHRPDGSPYFGVNSLVIDPLWPTCTVDVALWREPCVPP